MEMGRWIITADISKTGFLGSLEKERLFGSRALSACAKRAYTAPQHPTDRF